MGLYQFAHAATYDGQNSLPEAARKQALDYRDQDLYDVPRLQGRARQAACPRRRTARSRRRASASRAPARSRPRKPLTEEDFIKAHPDLGLWQTAVKDPLTKDGGEAYFEMNVKGTLLPGGANGVQKFKAKIVSMTPEIKPQADRAGSGAAQRSRRHPGAVSSVAGQDGSRARNCNLKVSRKSYTKQPFMVVLRRRSKSDRRLDRQERRARPKSPAGRSKAKAKAKAQ